MGQECLGNTGRAPHAHRRLPQLRDNFIALYVLYGLNLALPLVLLPFLGRVLGLEMFGLLSVAQGLGAYLGIISEYGFSLAGAREVARKRDERSELARILSSVAAAKLALCAVTAVIAVPIVLLMPSLRAQPVLAAMAVLAGMVQSLSVAWYFQGIERMRLVAALEISAKIVATGAILLVVAGPADAYRVPVAYFTAQLLAVIVGHWLAWRELPIVMPSLTDIRQALGMGWNLFVFRNAVSLYTIANPFLFSLFAPTWAVGLFAGADKIAKALAGLAVPLNQGLFPRLSHLVTTDRTEAKRVLRVTLILVSVAGICVAIGVFVLAPVFVRLLLGRNFMASVPLLRILAPVPLMIGISNVLGLQWMVSQGLERQFNRIVFIAAGANVVLALTVVRSFHEYGMATATLSVETLVTLGVLQFVFRGQVERQRAVRGDEQGEGDGDGVGRMTGTWAWDR